MATEQVLIEFVTDTTQLDPTIAILEKMGQIDAKAAENFKKGNAELEKRNQVSQKVVETTGKHIATTKDLEKSVGKLGDALEEAISTTVISGIEEINRRYETMQKRANAAGISVLELAKRQEELKQKLSNNQAVGPFQKLTNSVSEAEKKVLSLSARLNTLTAKGISDGPLFDRLTKELPKAQAELAKLRGQYDEVTSAAERNKTATDKVSNSQVTLKKQLREMKVVISEMLLAGDSQSAKFKQLVAEAGQLEDAIGDANEEIRRAASDTSGLDRTISAVGAGVGAYTAFAGAAALAGDSSEEFQATMQKLVAVMSIMNGLQALQTELARHDSLIKKGLIGIQKAWTAAITETNVALRITKVALMATGIGAFIVLLGVLVENWDKVKDAIMGTNDATRAAAREQERLNAVHEKSIDGYVKEAIQMESLTRRVKQGNLSIKEREAVVKDYNEQFGKTIGVAEDFKDAEKKILDQGPKYIQMLQLKAEEHAAFELAVEASREALKNERKALDEYVSWWDATMAYIKSGGNIGKAGIRLAEQASETQKAEQVRLEENKKKFAELAQQRKEAAQAIADENRFVLDDTKKNAEKEVDAVRMALEEKKALRQRELIGIKENIQAYVDKQKEVIEAEKQLALHSAKGINQRALIIAEAEQKIADLQIAFNLKKAEERNELEVTNARNRIALIEQTGQAELQARKDLLDIEAEQQKKHIRDTIDNEELRAAKILEIENKLNTDKKALQDDADRNTAKYDAEITELKRAGQVLAKERELIGEKDKSVITRINDEIKNLRLQNIQDEIDLNESLFQRGLIKREEYEKAKIGLANKYAGAQLAIDQEIADKQIKIQEDKAQREKEIEQQLRDAAFDIARAGMDAIFEISKAKRDAQLQNELSALDTQRQKELSNKNLTENQKAEIEKRYREKERQAKIKAWKADKQAAKTQAVINGALAVVKALPNLILAGVASAMTGIQIATINAQPMPAFAKGTKNAPKGYALVGEEGPEVVYFKGGERVFTHTESKTLMKEWEKPTFTLPAVKSEVVTTTTQGERFDYEKLGQEIAKNVPQVGMDVNSDGFVAWMRQGNIRTKFKNSRYKL